MSAEERLLPLFEAFHSFQGEGCHMGRNAWFIRLFGCPVHCPWCDSAGTWHPEHIPERIEKFAPQLLAEEAALARPDFVVITGGEPAIHDLTALTARLHALGQRVHLETSGAFPLRGEFDWVTLSPKRWKPPAAEAVSRADEFKVIVDRPGEVAFWEAQLGLAQLGKPTWLHPEASLMKDAAILGEITEWVKLHGHPFRAGCQLHKFYDVR